MADKSLFRVEGRGSASFDVVDTGTVTRLLLNDADIASGAVAAGNNLVILTRNTAGDPLTWTQNGTSFTATYNTDGTVATIAGGGTTQTFSYTAGLLTGTVVS